MCSWVVSVCVEYINTANICICLPGCYIGSGKFANTWEHNSSVRQAWKAKSIYGTQITAKWERRCNFPSKPSCEQPCSNSDANDLTYSSDMPLSRTHKRSRTHTHTNTHTPLSRRAAQQDFLICSLWCRSIESGPRAGTGRGEGIPQYNLGSSCPTMLLENFRGGGTAQGLTETQHCKYNTTCQIL